MQSFLVTLAVCLGATFAYVPLDFLHDQDIAADIAYPLTSSQYMKAILDRHSSVLVDDFLMTKLDPASLDVLLNKLERTGLDQAAYIARVVNLKQIIVDQQLESLTLFAPTNDAIDRWIDQLPANEAVDFQLLTNLAKAWVVTKKVAMKDMTNEMQIPTLLENVKLRVNVYDAQITVNGAQIIHAAEVETDNAIVNGIDKMIFPLPDGDLVAELKKAGYFTKLIDLVQKAGLEDYIAKTDALTCFAPTDAAWARVPARKMADLVANKTKLHRLLKYHIVPSTFYSAGLRIKQNVKSAAGEKIAITYDAQKDEYKINADPAQPYLAPKIIKKDIPATNGVLHIVDELLELPQKRTSLKDYDIH